MSTYTKRVKHPITEKWEEAVFVDDMFGSHNYGVKFPDGSIFDLRDFPELETQTDAEPHIEKVISELFDKKEVCVFTLGGEINKFVSISSLRRSLQRLADLIEKK